MYLLERLTKEGMMSLVTPLSGSKTATRVITANIVGLETDELFWAMMTVSAPPCGDHQ
jgi:hypothetical protein